MGLEIEEYIAAIGRGRMWGCLHGLVVGGARDRGSILTPGASKEE